MMNNGASAGPSETIELPSIPSAPAPILSLEQNVDVWPVQPGFRAFWGWCQRRCERIKGKEVMSTGGHSEHAAVAHLMNMLDQMIEWVDEAPPQPQGNQRFGNLAFRTYYRLIEDRIPPLFASSSLPPHLSEQILPLLLNSTAFGQPTRLDYGSGHELAFMLVLWCCVASGWTRKGVEMGTDADRDEGAGLERAEEVEDELILRVFPRYLDLVTLLQKTYRLEPAGSHGVWGLDDYCFFPYLFGSAQLLGSSTTPSVSLTNALNPSLSSSSITDLFTLSLRRVTEFKSGAPFSEHSPLLYNLSQMPNWHKPHYGLRKMFLGEVAGKRVVVQGIWIGGWCWGAKMPGDSDSDGEGAKRRSGTESRGNAPVQHASRLPDGHGQSVVTPAPWANSSSSSARMDGRAAVLERTRGAWA